MKRRVCKSILFATFFMGLLSLNAYAENRPVVVNIPAKTTVTGKPEESQKVGLTLSPVNETSPMPGDKLEVEKEVTVGDQTYFGEIKYTEPGDYLYRVSQKAGSADGWTFSNAEYLVTVQVLSDEKGGLKAGIYAKNESTGKKGDIVFESTYKSSKTPASSNSSKSGTSIGTTGSSSSRSSDKISQTGESMNFVYVLGVLIVTIVVLQWNISKLKKEKGNG